MEAVVLSNVASAAAAMATLRRLSHLGHVAAVAHRMGSARVAVTNKRILVSYKHICEAVLEALVSRTQRARTSRTATLQQRVATAQRFGKHAVAAAHARLNAAKERREQRLTARLQTAAANHGMQLACKTAKALLSGSRSVQSAHDRL